jgi:HEAT repeat protein
MPSHALRGRGLPARRAVRLVLAAALVLPALAGAQLSSDPDNPRGRLRDRYKTPQNSQKLDENLRKLKSEDPAERLEAVRGLGETNDPKAIETLVGVASDPDMRIRVKAIDTLGQIRAKEATPLLIQQLFMRDTDLGTKRRILVCLGKIGDDRATTPIIDFLSRDVDLEARGNAIFALGDIGDRKALPALEALAKNSPDENLRALAQDAIRKIQTRPAPAIVPPALAEDRRGPAAPGTP